MPFVQPSLLEQRKETAEQLARKQRMAAIVRRLKQQWEPVQPWLPAPLQRPGAALSRGECIQKSIR